MGKLLLMVMLGLAFVWWLRGGARRDAGGSARAPAAGPAGAGSALQTMVRCAHCGLHLPQAEALEHEGQAYCGRLHRLAGPRAPYARR
ncbi:PP0621 family protein [Sphaerotilus uruguayifluvii]|uniref:Uncharacterized protein n=1 Tax=Sphaerotilus uruguayifluvii TaxID=2735897 RepID=A0ABX2FXA2_9BURK|nr:PP0621 family protein [Leptothrix sp. C29]NRT54587.1 uncharacterized protein [Leptothrix sp. C29]